MKKPLFSDRSHHLSESEWTRLDLCLSRIFYGTLTALLALALAVWICTGGRLF